MWTARNAIGLAVAVGMIACVDATEPTSTGPVPYEGTKVSMTGTSTISIPTLDGRVVSATTREWAVDGIVTNGLAEAAQSRVITDPSGPKMPILFISDASPLARGRANERAFVTGRDTRGNVEDFVFVNGEAGPAKTIVHLGASRQIDQAYSFEWKKVRGGWMAMAFTATVFKNGKVLAQIRSARKGLTKPGSLAAFDEQSACIFDAKVQCDGPPVLSGDPGAGWSGGGGGPCDCSTELTDYLLAAATFATAAQLAVDTGTVLVPWVAAGLVVMGAAAAVMLYRYNSCVQACARLLGVSGRSTISGSLLASIDRYYLRPA